MESKARRLQPRLAGMGPFFWSFLQVFFSIEFGSEDAAGEECFNLLNGGARMPTVQADELPELQAEKKFVRRFCLGYLLLLATPLPTGGAPVEIGTSIREHVNEKSNRNSVDRTNGVNNSV